MKANFLIYFAERKDESIKKYKKNFRKTFQIEKLLSNKNILLNYYR